MSKTRITEADVKRAARGVIRAAKEAGASEVTVDGEGVIRIALMASATPIEPASNLDEIWAPSEALQRYLERTESG
jgi:hypothetical protein